MLNRMHSGSHSAVFEIPQSCEDLRLSFRIAYSSAAAEIDWLRLRWVNFAGAAFQPGGISVAEYPPAEMVRRASAAAATTSVQLWRLRRQLRMARQALGRGANRR